MIIIMMMVVQCRCYCSAIVQTGMLFHDDDISSRLFFYFRMNKFRRSTRFFFVFFPSTSILISIVIIFFIQYACIRSCIHTATTVAAFVLVSYLRVQLSSLLSTMHHSKYIFTYVHGAQYIICNRGRLKRQENLLMSSCTKRMRA